MRTNVAKKDGEISLMQMSLVKTAAEKEAINKNAAQLEKKVSDLTAQKQLFASVIESLTKKGDELDSVPAVPILTTQVQSQAPAPADQSQAPGTNDQN